MRRFEHGWLAYKQAANPELLATAKPVKLMTALGYDRSNDQLNGAAKSPIVGRAVNRLQDLHQDLADCAVVSEPGVLAKTDGLYLALVCHRVRFFGLLGIASDVILLKCARPCDATAAGAWTYADRILVASDAEALALRKFSAAELFTTGGQDFIMVSPEGTVPGDDAYNGCAVFRFDDIAQAKIAREADNRPRLHSFFQLEKGSFNGACAFLPGGPGTRFLIGRIDFTPRHGVIEPLFRIFRTAVSLRNEGAK